MIARCLLPMVLIASCFSVAAAPASTPVPKNAYQYLPQLVDAQQTIWPSAPMPSFLAAQVEQESCISLTHSKCWNPKAQLKTKREWGRGLGQVTTAYRADGSIRFDKQEELRRQFPSLRGWTTERWADPHYQLTAIVEMDKSIYHRQRDAATDRDRLSFTLSAYNGGESGVLQDRRLCANTPGCDKNRWAGHVEKTSLKSKQPHPGYRQSFFAINREYVTNVLDVRRPKYDHFFKR
ncbi:MAG: hypothetical protein ACRCUB_05900 [Plesiomonas shigelloides]